MTTPLQNGRKGVLGGAPPAFWTPFAWRRVDDCSDNDKQGAKGV
jgi:hypothetical protein